MSILAWIVLGLIAGFIASKIVGGSGQGILLDIVLGIVGAVVGGYLFSAFGATGVTGKFLARAGPPRRSPACRDRGHETLQERQAFARIPLPPQGWLLSLGE